MENQLIFVKEMFASGQIEITEEILCLYVILSKLFKQKHTLDI